MGTAINLNLASVVGEGEDCGDLSVLFLERYDPVEFFYWYNSLHAFLFRITRLRIEVLLRWILLYQQLCTCVCVCVSTYHITCHIPSATPSLLPACPAKQVWKLSHTWPRELIILDPGPITPHYPLCLPLRGELCDNRVTWKSAVAQDRWTLLMDTSVRLCLLRRPGWLAFHSLSLFRSTCTKEAIVPDHSPRPLELKCRGPPATKAGKEILKGGDDKKV